MFCGKLYDVMKLSVGRGYNVFGSPSSNATNIFVFRMLYSAICIYIYIYI